MLYEVITFAERNLSAESTQLLQGQGPRTNARVEKGKQVEKRPRPTLQAK